MTDNKSLEEKVLNLFKIYRALPTRAVERRVISLFKQQRTKDIQNISYMFAIPVEDLQKALAAKDEPLANKEIKDE